MTTDVYYASLSSGDAYSDRQLTLNLELWVEFLCADMFPYEDSKTMSVCPYPKKSNHLSFVNISPTLVFDTSMERSSRVLKHGNPKKLNFSPKKVEIEFWLVLWLVPKCWNHPIFVNTSPTVVIGTWLEKFSRVLQRGNRKNDFFNAYLSVSAVIFMHPRPPGRHIGIDG